MKTFGAILTALLLTAAASSANATAVGFTVKSGATTVATGSFTYTSLNTNLAYADLDTFSITFTTGATATYNLAFANASTQYKYFNFDTVAGAFVPSFVNGVGGNINTLLGAINSGFTQGFIIRAIAPPGDGVYSEFTIPVYSQPFTTVEYTNGNGNGTGVPEPATIALFGVGLLGLSKLLRRRETI